MRAVIGKGVGSASRRGPAELAEAPEGTRGPICVGAGGGEENSKWKAEPGAWDPSRQSQVKAPSLFPFFFPAAGLQPRPNKPGLGRKGEGADAACCIALAVTPGIPQTPLLRNPSDRFP